MIEVYGRTTPVCPSCVNAKNLLDARGLVYKFISFPEDISVEEFQAKFPGRRTVPQILINGTLLDNGFDSLKEEIDNLTGGIGHDFS
jgi:glutaredoxin